MCARFKSRGQIYQPGQQIPTYSAEEPSHLLWDGFARRESLRTWEKKGARNATIHADGFAERSRRTGELVWKDAPISFAAIILPREKTVRVVTRPCSPEEATFFGHDRCPQETTEKV